MQEVCIEHSQSIFHLIGNSIVTGIALPGSAELSKSGKADASQNITAEAFKLFNVAPKLEQYITQYGSHVFYLGTFKNSSEGIFKLFYFPVRYRYGDDLDLTMITKSCEDLVIMKQRFHLQSFILPTFYYANQLDEFNKVYKPMMDLILDDSFLFVYKK